ncbi:DUF3986 family protein [Metabacillus litoralis]|uniref:DUF3986 family protein n=1 Tax=Metabacillus litoralis TaxID=152268 RepID=UPI001CFDFA0F|nr:DUF3986 family protein [Metabacillus litoralis]
MSEKYDPRYHLHLGYYEDSYDLESIAFKIQSQDVWDIFFDFKFYNLVNQKQNQVEHEDFGTKILSIDCHDLSYDDGVKMFKEWLIEQGFI